MSSANQDPPAEESEGLAKSTSAESPSADVTPLTPSEIPRPDETPPATGISGFFSTPRGQALTARGLKLLPWISLIVAIVSAILMDRTYKSAWMVIVAALLSWAALIGFALLSSLDADDFQGKKRLAVKAASLLSLVATQSLIQQCLFFSIPFYVGASSFKLTHVYFLVVLFGAAAVTLWDPIYEWVMALAPLRFFLMAFSVFAGLNAVIPVLGLGNGASLFVAGLFAGLGVPVQSWLLMPHRERPSADDDAGTFRAIQTDFLGIAPKQWFLNTRAARWSRIQFAALIVGILVPLVVISVLAPFIPPAPLELIHIQMQPERSKTRDDVADSLPYIPDEINCVTWIWGPGGFHDELLHVWKKDGKVVDQVPLRVLNKTDWEKYRLANLAKAKKLGKAQKQKWGFRTNSRKRHLTRNPVGLWECSVETKSGQLLGGSKLRIAPDGSPRPSPVKAVQGNDGDESDDDIAEEATPPEAPGDEPNNERGEGDGEPNEG